MRLLTVAMSVFLTALSGFAQDTVKTTAPAASAAPTEKVGLRFALVKPSLGAAISCTGCKGEAEWPGLHGLSIGYAKLPVRDVGFSAAITHLTNSNDKFRDNGILIVEGNAGYAFDEKLSLKGGLNISDLTGKKLDLNTSMGLGLQASMGYQFNRTVGFDLGLVKLSQNLSAKNTNRSGTLNWDGIEARLHATF